MARELLFSVTAADCTWSYTKGTGAGGQKRNKTSSAVHCTHRASGAHGYSETSRSQHDNKADAFRKMCETQRFRDWHRLEVARRTGALAEIERRVAEAMHPSNLQLDVKDEHGRWATVAELPPETPE